MTLRSSDLQSDSDLDSIRNSCDVYTTKFPSVSDKIAFLFNKMLFIRPNYFLLFDELFFILDKIVCLFNKIAFCYSKKLLTRGVARTENAWEKEAQAAAPQNIFLKLLHLSRRSSWARGRGRSKRKKMVVVDKVDKVLHFLDKGLQIGQLVFWI